MVLRLRFILHCSYTVSWSYCCCLYWVWTTILVVDQMGIRLISVEVDWAWQKCVSKTFCIKYFPDTFQTLSWYCSDTVQRLSWQSWTYFPGMFNLFWTLSQTWKKLQAVQAALADILSKIPLFWGHFESNIPHLWQKMEEEEVKMRNWG